MPRLALLIINNVSLLALLYDSIVNQCELLNKKVNQLFLDGKNRFRLVLTLGYYIVTSLKLLKANNTFQIQLFRCQSHSFFFTDHLFTIFKKKDA